MKSRFLSKFTDVEQAYFVSDSCSFPGDPLVCTADAGYCKLIGKNGDDARLCFKTTLGLRILGFCQLQQLCDSL